jgi:predicted DNA-binding protein
MYTSYIMRRTQIYLGDDQAERLTRRARTSGVTKSTLIREAVEAYLSTPDDADELARFRAAVDAVAAEPIDLPDGESYVEAIRSADLARDAELEERRSAAKRPARRR